LKIFDFFVILAALLGFVLEASIVSCSNNQMFW
jgi:hypothetical protein